jgi:hypothetical protein
MPEPHSNDWAAESPHVGRNADDIEEASGRFLGFRHNAQQASKRWTVASS